MLFSFDTNSLQPTHKQMPRFIHKRRHTFVNEPSYYMARAQINSAAWRDGLTVERATGHAQGLFYSKRKSKDAKEFEETCFPPRHLLRTSWTTSWPLSSPDSIDSNAADGPHLPILIVNFSSTRSFRSSILTRTHTRTQINS